MMEILGALMSSKIFSKLTQDASSTASILGTPIISLSGDRIKIRENFSDLTPELYEALSSTGYSGRTMKNEEDILMMYNIISDLGYTSRKDRQSNRRNILYNNSS